MKTVKYIFKSLFSNNAALEGRDKKWWFALLIFLLSLVLSLIPTMVSIGTASGSSFLKANTNSADVGLKEFVKDLNTRNIDLTVTLKDGEKMKHQLIINSPSDTENIVLDEEGLIYQYKHFDNEEEKLRLSVYYRDESYDETSAFIKTIQARVYSPDSTVEEEKIKPSSYLILGRERIYMAIYEKSANDWKKPKSSYAGDYIKIHVNTNIKDFTLASDTEDKIMSRWQDFFHNGYLNLRTSALLIQTVSYLGINVIVTFFMGLMIFIITRGKKNPYRTEYNFLKSMKVIAIAALSPAILTCGLGFAFTSFAPMLFMILIGFRTMWMASKNLNPAIAYQNQK